MTPLDASRRQFLRTASVVAGSVGAAGAPFALNLASLGTARRPDRARLQGDRLPLPLRRQRLVEHGAAHRHRVVRRVHAAARDRRRTRSRCSRRARRPTPARRGPRRRASAACCRSRRKFTACDRERGQHLRPASEHARGARACSRAGRLAVLANVGPLVVPLTRADYTRELEAAAAGARLAQRPAVDLAGARPRRRQGRLGRPPRRPGRERQRQRRLHQHLGLRQRRLLGRPDDVPVPGRHRRRGRRSAASRGTLFGSSTAAATLRAIVTADNQHLFAKEYGAIVSRSIDAQADVPGRVRRLGRSRRRRSTSSHRPATTPPTAWRSSCRPSRAIIGARSALGAKRQVFFVALGGFDTHDTQNTHQADLMARLSHALAYFDTALARRWRRPAQQRDPLHRLATSAGRSPATATAPTTAGAATTSSRAARSRAARSTGASRSSASTTAGLGQQRLPAGDLGRHARQHARALVRRRAMPTSITVFPNLTELPARPRLPESGLSAARAFGRDAIRRRRARAGTGSPRRGARS